MRAAYYTRTGAAADVLELADLAEPVAGPGEVLVRVRASGINPADVKRRAGWRGVAMAHPRIIPHCDGAGEIVDIGPGVENRKTGDRVWIWNAQGGYDGPGRANGTAAQYIAIAASQTALLPDAITMEAGACLGVPAMTAHYAVFADGAVEGKTLLVQGGGGAVAHFAIQFAVCNGARVVATAGSPERADHARNAGAELVLDRHDKALAERIMEATAGGIDRIIESEFGGNLETDVAVLKPGGVIAAYSSTAVPTPVFPYYTLAARGGAVRVIQSFGFSPEIRVAAARMVSAMSASGDLQVAIGKTFELDAIAAAHEAVENQQVIGNVVIRI
jgi:NADPH2:quinone reductase